MLGFYLRTFLGNGSPAVPREGLWLHAVVAFEGLPPPPLADHQHDGARFCVDRMECEGAFCACRTACSIRLQASCNCACCSQHVNMQSASSLLSRSSACPVAPFAPARRALVIQNAHKKGAGSTKNGRDVSAMEYNTSRIEYAAMRRRCCRTAGALVATPTACGSQETCIPYYAHVSLVAQCTCDVVPLQSNPQRRGIKIYGGQPVKAGGIIYRQVGSTWHSGTNTGIGSDFTVYSKVDGIVVYDKKKVRPSVSARLSRTSLCWLHRTRHERQTQGMTAIPVASMMEMST
eukprot:364786-Chlamydomonas_euryale.AAC.19